MNGGPQFIEVTEKVTGDPRIVSLRCICFIRKDLGGEAVIDFTSGATRLVCRESYETVRMALMHNQPPPM